MITLLTLAGNMGYTSGGVVLTGTQDAGDMKGRYGEQKRVID